MKKEQWQAVYAPDEKALDRRVQQAISQLRDDVPARRVSARRMLLIAAALMLMLAAAAAVAAGLARSAK